MTERNNALTLLRTALGNPNADFREGQWEAINSLVNKQKNLLVVQRTGWGKSSVYFIATRILRNRDRGLTLIVSPLLALMHNQIEAAERLGIRAITINSTNKNKWPEHYETVKKNKADVLLISPERLADDQFVSVVLTNPNLPIGLLVVDEAHCISDWGHDFRPDYRRLINVLQRIPANVPILGTTATANNRVINDVKAQLGNIGIQRGPLMRETLALQNIRLPPQAARLDWLAKHINSLPGTGIIYTLTRPGANRVADWLNQHDISAKAYYSDVTDEDFEDSNAYRQHLEGLLLNNEIKALVATAALSMGYDKPDLDYVIHYQAPGSVIAYYQQVGRAGRGIDHAVGVLLSGYEDDHIQKFFRKNAFPSEHWIVSILEALEKNNGLTTEELEKIVNLKGKHIEQVGKFLSADNPAPIIKDGSKWQRTPVPYRMDHDRISRLTEQRVIEWQEIQKYLDTSDCLMEFLARSLDDTEAKPCGRCASCRKTDIVKPSSKRKTPITAGRFLKHSETPLKCNTRIEKGAFTKYAFRGNLPDDMRAKTGRVLSRYGDAGWGQIVANDKRSGSFRDKLVTAVAEMIAERWEPTPAPQWVTCVPSKNQPSLVPSYAERLAAVLGLPYIPVVKKVCDNEPQKEQQNRFHQCRNLDGVFAIKGNVPEEAVLLVDDVVDSAWTLTVIAALLRQSGCSNVWPLALTTSG